MDSFIIREAQISDLKDVQRLSQDLIEFEDEIIKEDYLVSLDWALNQDGYNNYKKNIENDYLYVACKENDIIGYMTCWINKKNPWDKYDTLEIGNLYIRKEYRNLGIGKRFIEIAKKICKEKNIKYLELKDLSENKSAREFYKKMKFSEYIITEYIKIK